MGVRTRRGGRWWWLAIISAFILVISGLGTALALWSAQVKGEGVEIGTPVVGFAVTIDEQTSVAQDQTVINRVVDFTGPTAITTGAGSAVAFEVSMLVSPGYTMDYSLTSSSSAPVFFRIGDSAECTPDNLSYVTYNQGDLVPGIQGTVNTARTDLWCAVLFTAPPGTYKNTVTVAGTDATGTKTTATGTWTIGVAGVSNDGDFSMDIQPIVGEESAS